MRNLAAYFVIFFTFTVAPLASFGSSECPYGTRVQVNISCQGNEKTAVNLVSFQGDFTLDSEQSKSITAYAYGGTAVESSICTYTASSWNSEYLIRKPDGKFDNKFIRSIEDLEGILSELKSHGIADWISRDLLIIPTLKVTTSSLGLAENLSLILGFEEVIDSKVGVITRDFYSAREFIDNNNPRYKEFFFVTGDHCKFSYDIGSGPTSVGFFNQ